MKLDPSQLGQFFTPPHIVETMWSLKHNSGSILEPSSGNNAFLQSPAAKNLPITAIEIDPSFNLPLNNSHKTLTLDFFDYPLSEQFDTIIGNPPYIRFQDILPTTRKKILALQHSLRKTTHADTSAYTLTHTPSDTHPNAIAHTSASAPTFDSRTNLYLFFIYKAVLHLKDKGELIFITPRDFTKATSAKNLNEFLYNNGTITHFQDYGDTKIFHNATPNCAIWRFEKRNIPPHKTPPRKTPSIMADGRTFLCHNGQLTFAPAKILRSPAQHNQAQHSYRLGDIFEVKVGAVSGADHIYQSQHGEQEFVCSQTRATGNLKRMIYNKINKALLPHKQELLARRIRKFNENNWWEWGRNYPERSGARIYVNAKTRIAQPFFVSKAEAFDGSVLALFPKRQAKDKRKNKAYDLAQACDQLNRLDWRALGFMTGGRYLFSQRSLENANINLDL